MQIDSQWSAFCKHVHIVAEPLSKHAKEQETFPSPKQEVSHATHLDPRDFPEGEGEKPDTTCFFRCVARFCNKTRWCGCSSSIATNPVVNVSTAEKQAAASYCLVSNKVQCRGRSVTQSGGELQIYIQRVSGSESQPPGKHALGCRCHRGRPCSLCWPGAEGGPGRGSTWPPRRDAAR